MYRKVGKRLLDLILVIGTSPLWLTVVAMLAITLRILQGRGVLFRQLRPGFDGRSFVLLKLRTMTEDRDAAGNLLPDADRLTWIGRFLRRTSLDELPELWNVLRGEMSLVGPRPLLMHYLDHYTPEQSRRHDVLPGITGLAQISGRNELSWQKRFELDVWYVDHLSLELDLRILFKTLWQLPSGKGVAQEGRATVDYFDGSVEEDESIGR